MNSELIPTETGNQKFLQKLQVMGIDVHACFQCGRCSSGCPIGDFFDLQVMEVVRLASYGAEDILLQSKTIWLCAACETCATRCPNEIEIAGLMDVLRSLALKKRITPAEPRVPMLHRSFLDSVKHWGRTYEIGMLAGYKLRSGDLVGDMKLGLQMFTKGKLKLVPQGIKGKAEVRQIFSGKGKEYDR
ncbi:4Fe-4S dicluster domain-containing protein [Desulfoprunum benzoelyticum]|uniref:Heterodisulfide reductase subunit C n=1 Tax=Desulfoprunum benzoelyticum TaxID=1506996 RepID=A0A840V2B5_9BACT|nr:4Fe-4S dicluster domain-containing protein [Desulfoprunum benzoelyticum]MBB5348010.1 heterodisulfide reductase subunit C [Desulfoprunum benzoelyticum]MBM9530422.1 4Fe-4S dicluster domain-containing protein [Desulfoprunum benzoelyticum]